LSEARRIVYLNTWKNIRYWKNVYTKEKTVELEEPPNKNAQIMRNNSFQVILRDSIDQVKIISTL